jgi:hypothetical protein|tara:strand:+ start:488 stop:709 length:222 start_codon:yes stop_codon:yes gene_type:complete
MSPEDDIRTLSQYEHFARFINVIKQRRESSIGRLRNSSPEEVMQVSGEICAYDDILQDADYEVLLKKWQEHVD